MLGDFLSLIPKPLNVLKIALTTGLSGLFPEFLFENKSPFAPLSLPIDIPRWICIFVFHHLRSKLSVEVRGV